MQKILRMSSRARLGNDMGEYGRRADAVSGVVPNEENAVTLLSTTTASHYVSDRLFLAGHILQQTKSQTSWMTWEIHI